MSIEIQPEQRIDKLTIKISGASRYKKEEQQQEMFYFELRTVNSSESNIEDGVLINNEGSVEASRDILADALSIRLIQNRKEGVLMDELQEIYKEIRYI